MFINGKNTELFGAKLLADYKYTPPEISADYFKGRRWSNFTVLDSDVGMGKLELTLVFHARGRRDATQNKSAFDRLCVGKTDLALAMGISILRY